YVAHRLLSGTLPRAAPWRRGLEVAIVLAVFASGLAFALRFNRLEQAGLHILHSVLWIGIAAIVLAAAARFRHKQPVLICGALIGFLTLDLAINNGPNGATAMQSSELAMLEPNTHNATIAFLKRKVASTMTTTRRDRVE